MLIGLIFWSFYFSVEVKRIEEEFGFEYLRNLNSIGTLSPRTSYFYTYTNIYLYYAQTMIDVCIVVMIKCHRRVYINDEDDERCEKYEGIIDTMVTLSIILNVFNVIQMYMLKNFIFGYSLSSNIPPDNPFYGYL